MMRGKDSNINMRLRHVGTDGRIVVFVSLRTVDVP